MKIRWGAWLVAAAWAAQVHAGQGTGPDAQAEDSVSLVRFVYLRLGLRVGG